MIDDDFADESTAVQTPGNSGNPTPDSDEDLCSVLVKTIDALQAGQTMRSLAADHRRQMPPVVREIFHRVGTQLASAATAKLTAKRAKRADGSR